MDHNEPTTPRLRRGLPAPSLASVALTLFVDHWVRADPGRADVLALTSLGWGSGRRCAAALGTGVAALDVRRNRARAAFGTLQALLADRFGIDAEQAHAEALDALCNHVRRRLQDPRLARNRRDVFVEALASFESGTEVRS